MRLTRARKKIRRNAQTRARELADDHRLEAGVAYQSRSHLQRLGIIAGDRDCELRIRAVRLSHQDP
jgi:hypothetical protein